jgi:hypothetical protein
MPTTSAGTPVDFPIHAAAAAPSGSAVSWGAIIAGAAGTAALSLILTLLGLGLGFSAVSPWVNDGASATKIGLSAIAWLTLTQLLASALGGYLAGRLRTRWPQLHPDEVHFRDSAHGFLAWAVATLATVALLTSALASIVGGTVRAGASMAGAAGPAAMAGAASAAGGMLPGADRAGEDGGLAYLLDSLFRQSTDVPDGAQRQPVTERDAREVRRIILETVRTGDLPAQERRHLGRMIAERTGLTPEQAEARVSATYAALQTRLREAESTAWQVADEARKASAKVTLWMFISLLVGAFVASVAGIYGGRQRDD